MKKIFLMLLLLTACKYDDIQMKEKASSSDYIIFGHFYGFCMGEKCIEIYKLTDTSLAEDSNDTYPNGNTAYVGNYKQLSSVTFEKIKNLKTKVPDELLAINDRVIGTPDAGDWGGLYFEISRDGKTQFWLIDKMKSNLPSSIVPFAQEIEKAIALIND